MESPKYGHENVAGKSWINSKPEIENIWKYYSTIYLRKKGKIHNFINWKNKLKNSKANKEIYSYCLMNFSEFIMPMIVSN